MKRKVYWLFLIGAAILLQNITLAVIDPNNPPTSMRVTVDKSGQTRTFNLDQYDMRGADFEIVLLAADGVTQTTIDPGPVRTYRGWCEEESDSYVEATLLPNGDLRYHVLKGAAVDWWYNPPYETDDTAGAVNNFTEIGGTSVQPSGTVYPGASFTVSAATLNDFYRNVYQATVGFDLTVEYVNGVDYAYWESYGRKAENAVSHYNAIYPRDALLEWRLGKVVVRQSRAGLDYSDAQWGLKWWDINTYWESLFPNVDHNYVGFVGAVGGGVAFMCDYGGENWAARSYNGWNGDGNWWQVARHEMGHNSGALDWAGNYAEYATIMNGNNIGISRISHQEVSEFMRCRSGRTQHLSYVGPYSYPIPPYVNFDDGMTAYVGQSLSLDVLGNDYDANGDDIAIAGFETTSDLGGTVSFSAGTGPDGRDELIYTAPTNTVGTDRFQYSIVDSTGRTATGYVRIYLELANALKGYWPMDETVGTTAKDLSVSAHDATLAGGATFDANSLTGPFDGAISLDGEDDHLSISGPELVSNTVTITGWVKRDGDQADWSGIVFSRAGRACGLNIGTANELRYHWNDTSTTYNWNSGLVLPDNTWTFVALVVEPAKATIYMNTGGATQSRTNAVSHSPGTFNGTTYLGWDSTNTSRHFKGALDEIRIYNYALNASEIAAVIAGGAVESPKPFDNAQGVKVGDLSWVPSAAATSYDVYIGTNVTAVTNADTGSPEYQGTITEPADYYDIQPETTYYWRVDTVTATGTVKGRVWTFSTAGYVIESGLVAYWPLNDAAGSTAADWGPNGSDGTLNGPAWDTGFAGGALRFDGVDDSVTFGTGPSLSGPTDFTVSAWIKTGSSSEQVIIQQRNGGFNGQYAFRVLANGTVHFYIYGDGGYQYGFATTTTVNDGQWHFVAAVRQGQNGYIYIDGNPVPAASASGAVRNLNGGIGVGIGRDIRDNNKPFNGWIDDVRIYDFAKTGAQLENLYDSYFEIPTDDTTPPTPDPMTFETAPHATGATSVSMTAATATDSSGVEYYFTCVSGGGHDSGWQSIPIYEDTGLQPAGVYAYTVQARDKSADQNTTGVSDAESVRTPIAVNINNHSFELPGTVKQGSWTNVPGWNSDTTASDSGVETGWTPTDGSWTGFMMGSDPPVWNLTDHVIASGRVYTLKVDARQTGGGNSLRMDLFYDNGGSRVSAATKTVTLTGGMVEYILTFSADDVPAAFGKRIGIELNNAAGGATWLGFDNVRLTYVRSEFYDGRMGLSDFAGFARQWIRTDCGYCGGAELTGDGSVNIDDLRVFAENWLGQ